MVAGAGLRLDVADRRSEQDGVIGTGRRVRDTEWLDEVLAQGCVGTSPTCPSFLRTEFSADCLQYDKGSVDGCLAFYKTKTTCEDLRKALDECVITAYTDSAPAGCP